MQMPLLLAVTLLALVRAAPRVVDIGVVLCDNAAADPARPSPALIRSRLRQWQQYGVLFKSVALRSPPQWAFRVHWMTTRALFVDVPRRVFGGWPADARARFREHFVDIYAHALRAADGLEHFWAANRPCSFARHFWPYALPDVVELLFFDSDMIVLAPLADLLGHLERFNASQALAMSAMLHARNPNFRLFPKVHHRGLDDGINAGVALQRLDRQRALFDRRRYVEWIKTTATAYWDVFVFPNQDLFNVYTAQFPSLYYDLPCDWNVRKTWAANPKLAAKCDEARLGGTRALHAAGGHFHDTETNAFVVIFNEFLAHNMTDSFDLLRAKISAAFGYLPQRHFFLGRLSSNSG